MTESTEKIRIDKWLWAARFFKTRSQASQAVQGGKVHLNGQRVKPSRTVGAGDELRINKLEQVFEVTVRGVNQYRRPAREAQELYEESEASLKNREKHSQMRRLIRAPGTAPAKKPDKRDRRKIREFIRKD
jgi:ribosome-associated heat shock protein Hsp15